MHQAWELWKEGDALKLTDLALEINESCVGDQVLRTVHVGLLCVQENAMDRPTMSDVISMLGGSETMPLHDPKQPAFFTGRNALESASNEAKSREGSINYVSISAMEAR